MSILNHEAMNSRSWLSKLRNPLCPIPMKSLLRKSVYYPSAGDDGDPVKYLGKHFQSFVYVDYAVGRKRFLKALPAFRGYDIFMLREVRLNELFPSTWKPPTIRPEDGDPEFANHFKMPPFAVWAVYERSPGVLLEHGPKRFSLLYIGGDGALTYHALYYSHQVTPAVVAVIQPGTGYGCNWTDFEDPQKILARLVRENPAGMPDHFLYGGWEDGESYRDAPWPDFKTTGLVLHGRLRLFARRTESSLVTHPTQGPTEM